MIRKAEAKDLTAINEIYNQSVGVLHQTADITPITLDIRKKWFTEHDIKKYPIFVIEIDNRVIGWCSLSAYRKGRDALKLVAEVSYYIDKNYQSQGYGSKLLNYGIDAANKYNFETVIAILLEQNLASIKLLEKFGFKKWGALQKVADFDGVKFDHLYYGLKI